MRLCYYLIMAFSPETEKDISLIQVNSIWKSFKTGDHNTSILKNISTRIKPGEFVILFGPSGCGKSTLLNTLMGLEHPDKGDINFMGMKIWELDSDDRAVIRKKNIGIIYQQQNWVKSLNVIDNVALIGTLLGKSRLESREIAKEKLEIVGMLHRAEYKPYELSSGEQQRISLARSLMSNPALLIADEPTGNLDVKTGIKVMNIFKKLAEDGKTILMVTHNIESLDYADRILFMLDGQIRKDIEVKNEDINYIKTQINKDLEAFIQEIQDDKKDEQVKAPEPVPYKDYITKKRFNLKNFVESFWYNFVFLISMILLFSLFLPVYFVEYILFKKYVLSEKIKKFIMKVFNLLENRKKKINNSISSWDLGQISLGHLMEKKSRTLITVLGMGIGIGFITFLLSIGYGIENLVINEMLRIEEMRQVLVSPIVSSEIILDDEKLNLIKSVDGVKEIYPLISVATTIFYADSQMDVVAHGVDSQFLIVTKQTFLEGENFGGGNDQVVIGGDVTEMLGTEADNLLGKKISLEFVPVGTENEINTDTTITEELQRKEYTINGIVASTGAPVIYFPIEEAKALGIQDYSELLLVIDNDKEINQVRKEVEKYGTKTSSVMDTVSEVEKVFMYLRLGLGIIGAVAFLIAVLGMINTLTVSLMERTREVGLLKSIGMQSAEIKKLFITEAMLISFSGGVAGIVIGMLFGYLISIILSIISISRGGEFLLVSKVPFVLILSIIATSVIIGFFTGLYPSKRALKMSALDALRYE